MRWVSSSLILLTESQIVALYTFYVLFCLLYIQSAGDLPVITLRVVICSQQQSIYCLNFNEFVVLFILDFYVCAIVDCIKD